MNSNSSQDGDVQPSQSIETPLVGRVILYLVNGCLAVACATALFIALFGTIDTIVTYSLGRPLPLARELPEVLLVLRTRVGYEETFDSFDYCDIVVSSEGAEMSLSTTERTVLPPRESLEALVHLLDEPGAKLATEIRGPGGETIVLPAEVFELLRDVVKAMSEGQAVTIAPVFRYNKFGDSSFPGRVSRAFAKIIQAT